MCQRHLETKVQRKVRTWWSVGLSYRQRFILFVLQVIRCFHCGRDNELQEDRTVKTASAVAKSLSHWLSRISCFFPLGHFTYQQSPRTPALISFLEARTQALDWVLVPGLRGPVDSARQTVVMQLHKRHNSLPVLISLLHWTSSITPPQSTLSLLQNKKCKSASGWIKGSVHYSRNGEKSPDRLSSDSPLKILLEVEQCQDVSVNTEPTLISAVWLQLK